VRVGVRVEMPDHHRSRARSERERRELVEHIGDRRLRALQPGDRLLLGVAAALAVDDERVLDEAGVDGGGRQVDRVDEAETGVGQIEVGARRCQPELARSGPSVPMIGETPAFPLWKRVFSRICG
jgi:hypothetical protein